MQHPGSQVRGQPAAHAITQPLPDSRAADAAIDATAPSAGLGPVLNAVRVSNDRAAETPVEAAA